MSKQDGKAKIEDLTRDQEELAGEEAERAKGGSPTHGGSMFTRIAIRATGGTSTGRTSTPTGDSYGEDDLAIDTFKTIVGAT